MSATAAATAPTSPAADQQDFVQKLRKETLAVRVGVLKLGTRKALSAQQRKLAAEPFHADHKSLGASKKLLDTRDPAYRAVREVISRAKSHWKSMTTPYPEPGIRLIRKSSVALFDTFMQRCVSDLKEAAKALQDKYPELRDRAAAQLGELYDNADYLERVDGAFEIEWDYPSIDPPAHLKELHPDLYAAECKKIEARFSLAVEQAEEAFTQTFHQLVTHLVERLKGDDDGKPKIFRDTAISNLNSFFEQFKSLNVGSSTQLEQLVQKAQQAIGGVTPAQLRDSTDTRSAVEAALADVAQEIDQLMVTRPDRTYELEDDAP